MVTAAVESGEVSEAQTAPATHSGVSCEGPPRVDSLRARYLYKVLSNAVLLGTNVVVNALVPRALGPAAYGDYSFVTNFFTRFVGACSLNTGLGFFTKLSQRPTEQPLVTFYLYFSVAVGLAALLVIGLGQFFGVGDALWPHQQTLTIYLGAVWAFWTWFNEVLRSITDARAITRAAERVRVWLRLVYLVLIVALFVAGRLTLTAFFLAQFALLLCIDHATGRLLHQQGFGRLSLGKLPSDAWRRYGREFYQYAAPLIWYSIVATFVGILDRWVLQRYGGSSEQGYFGLAFQIGAACFLFIGAMTPLLMRDFSVAFRDRDVSRMAELFRRFIPLFYALAAFFACFVAVEAERIVRLFGGEGFRAAVVAVTIMAFYPVHQTYGQLSGSLFYATEQIALYRNIGISMMLLGVPLLYFLIGPHAWFGLALGSTGLAVKMVALQCIQVNVQLYFNTRYLRLPYHKFVVHQCVCLGYLLGLAWSASALVRIVSGPHLTWFTALLVDGGIYTAAVGGSLYWYPSVLGVRREDVQSLVARLKRRGQPTLQGMAG